MKRFLKFGALLATTSFALAAGAQVLEPTGSSTQGTKPGTARPLPVNQFGSVLSENIEWKPFPAFPPEARLAILVGEPSKPGPYVVRVKLPAGVKLMPHTHPEDRIYTVVSGIFYIGLGTTYDPAKLQAYAPGSVVVLPANTPHFHWAKDGDYMTQVAGTGPLGIKYVDPHDDPRNH